MGAEHNVRGDNYVMGAATKSDGQSIDISVREGVQRIENSWAT